MYTSTLIILVVMVATYIIVKALRVSTELSMFAAALRKHCWRIRHPR